MAAATSGLSSANGDTVVSRNPAPLFYVCGRFLSLKKPVVIPSFTAAITAIWGLKEKISIVEEEAGIFVFLFKNMEEKQRVLDGGPWFYGGSMIVLADYDGLRPLEDVALHHLEVWVAVKGLRTGMRDDLTLSRFGRELGEVVEVDPAAVRRRDVIQRFRIRHDVRRRILSRRWFDFSPEFPVLLETRYEKCHGICSDCGFFGHGGGVCDKGLAAVAMARSNGAAVTAPDGAAVTEPDGAAMTGPDGAAVTAPCVSVDGGVVPTFSAGSFALTGESSQLRTGPTGPGLNDGLLNVGLVKGSNDSDGSFDLSEPLIKLKKRGRPVGSKNRAPKKKKKKDVIFPVVKAAAIVCPDDKGKSTT